MGSRFLCLSTTNEKKSKFSILLKLAVVTETLTLSIYFILMAIESVQTVMHSARTNTIIEINNHGKILLIEIIVAATFLIEVLQQKLFTF